MKLLMECEWSAELLGGTTSPYELHGELAMRWHLSPNTVRHLVADELGVITITVDPLLHNRRNRHLVSSRIPGRWN